MIGPAHICTAPEADKLPPPLSLGRRDISFQRSRTLTAHNPSLTLKEIKITAVSAMSPGHQQVTGNTNSFNNNNNSLNSIVNFITGIDEEGRQILQWLSPLEPQQRHQGVRTDRLDGVGNWVLETNEFRKWRDAGDGCVEPVLFCYGNPGVGKTYAR